MLKIIAKILELIFRTVKQLNFSNRICLIIINYKLNKKLPLHKSFKSVSKIRTNLGYGAYQNNL